MRADVQREDLNPGETLGHHQETSEQRTNEKGIEQSAYCLKTKKWGGSGVHGGDGSLERPWGRQYTCSHSHCEKTVVAKPTGGKHLDKRKEGERGNSLQTG